MGYTTGTKWDYNLAKSYIEKENYKLISTEYKNKRTKMKMLCDKGHEIELSLDCFTKGVRCGECYKKERKTMNTLRRTPYSKVKQIFEDRGYKLLSKEYIPGVKLEYVCNNGHRNSMDFQLFKSGRGCPDCARNSLINLNTLSFEERAEMAKKKGYSLIKLENKKSVQATLSCKKEHKFKTSWSVFRREGFECPQCRLENRLMQHFNFYESQGYKILNADGYYGSLSKIKLQCPNGHEWETDWNSFHSNGTRCRHCSRSKGEEKVAEYLENNNINYIPQYSFDNCRNINRLKFDFYLPNLNVCIEYDGKQHYYPIDFSKKLTQVEKEEVFIKSKERDMKKTKYCLENNIILIRVPYWEFDNLEKYLEEKLFLNTL